MKIIKSIRANIKANLVPGIIVVVPVIITFIVFKWLINFFDDLLKPLIADYINIYIPGLGLVVSIIFIYLIGLSTKNYFGNKLFQVGEWFVIRIPVAKTVYMAVKQIMTTLTTKEDGKSQKVVLIEYPRNGIYSVGLFNGILKDPDTKQPLASVLIIASINPASGFTVLVPMHEVRFTELTIEQMMKFIVSGGIVIPDKINTVPGQVNE